MHCSLCNIERLAVYIYIYNMLYYSDIFRTYIRTSTKYLIMGPIVLIAYRIMILIVEYMSAACCCECVLCPILQIHSLYRQIFLTTIWSQIRSRWELRLTFDKKYTWNRVLRLFYVFNSETYTFYMHRNHSFCNHMT